MCEGSGSVDDGGAAAEPSIAKASQANPKFEEKIREGPNTTQHNNQRQQTIGGLLHIYVHLYNTIRRVPARTHLADVVAVEAAGGGEDDEVGEGVADVHLPLVAPRGEEVVRLLFWGVFWCGESEGGVGMGRRCGWREHEHNYRTRQQAPDPPENQPLYKTNTQHNASKHALALVIFST